MDDLVGFGFRPTAEEVIRLLEQKRLDPDFAVQAISETNVYDFEPGELFGLSQIQSNGKWCSFFCAPDYIKADSNRVRRSTKTGYWNLTGKGSQINAKGSTDAIGSKKILVFYERGQGRKGTKTDYVMHQFSAKDSPLYKKDFVVCRVKRSKDKKRRNSTYDKGQRHKKLRTSTDIEHQQHQNLCISISDEGQVNHHLAFDNHNHTTNTKNIFPESDLSPSNYPVSNSKNDVAENTFLESQLPPNTNLISKFRNRDEENSSISESRNHVEENTSISESRNRFEDYTSPSESRNLVEEYTSVSESRDHVEESISISESRNQKENTSPELQLLLQFLPSNYLISNSRNHDGENTSPELQLSPINSLISESRNHAEENTSPELELMSQLPANDYLISESRNHAEENTSPELELLSQLLANEYLISEPRNRVGENTSQELQLNTSQQLQLLPQCLPINNLISNARNHDEGNIIPHQLPSSNYLISSSRNQVIENTSPKSQLQSSNSLISDSGNHVVENALSGYFDLPTISTALEGNEVDEASFSTLWSLINEEQGSSNSSFSSSDYPPFGSEWENYFMNPQSVIHDPCEGTGHSILPLSFNSLEAGGGFCGEDSSDRGTETFNKWVSDIFQCNNPHV